MVNTISQLRGHTRPCGRGPGRHRAAQGGRALRPKPRAGRRSGVLTVVGTLAGLGLTLPGCGPSETAAPDAGFSFVVPSGLGPPLCTHVTSLPVATRPADVLILFDRSGSMNAAFGDGTRFSVEAELLKELLPHYEDKLRFGFARFPAKGTCGAARAASCCAESPVVPVGDRTADAIARAIDEAGPVEGNTPTADALEAAREHFARLADGVADRYVLLSTDGRPACTRSGAVPSAWAPGAAPAERTAACEDALAAADRLVAAGVRVLVLALGPELDGGDLGGASCLRELARRGSPPGLDGPAGVYQAVDPAQLEAALQRMFGGFARPSCVVELRAVPLDPAKVRVLVDGRQIPRSAASGWDFDPPGHARIRFHGRMCAELERFRYEKVEVRFGCIPCTTEEGRSCE